MAYPQFLMNVRLVANSASTANTIVAPTTSARVGGPGAHNFNVTVGDNWGSAVFDCGLMGYKVHAMGIELNADVANGFPLYLRRRTGAATCPEASLLTLNVPSAATGPITYRYATANIIGSPGTKFFVAVSTVVADVRANTYLLVSPVPEQFVNATAMATQVS